MQEAPLSVTQTWPTSNYIDPSDTRGNANAVLNIVLYSILLCFIGIRVFTRTHVRGSFGADDILILLATIPSTCFFILSIVADTKFVTTRHIYDIPTSNVIAGLKMALAAQLMFACACTLTKLSMLTLVQRILSSSSVLWIRITRIAYVTVAVQGIIFCIVIIFQCRPPQDYWKISKDPQPNCINQETTLLVAGIVNTLTDFLVVLLPIRTVCKLQLPTRQAVIIILLFCFGFICCCAGIIRTYYTYMLTHTWDQNWASFPVWLASAVEMYIGIICASIPATTPFFALYLPQVVGTSRSAHSRFSLSTSQQQPRHHNISEIGMKNLRGEETGGDENSPGLRVHRGGTSTSTVAARMEAWDGDEVGLIRIMQTIDVESSSNGDL